MGAEREEGESVEREREAAAMGKKEREGKEKRISGSLFKLPRLHCNPVVTVMIVATSN
jgi:hypothetical protein